MKILALAAVLMVALMSPAQANMVPANYIYESDMKRMKAFCPEFFSDALCGRLVDIGEDSIKYFAEALAILVTEDINKASIELKKMLALLELGFQPEIQGLAKRKGIEI